MFDFFRKLFAPERSSETAKERLRLVLLSDHLSLAPETIEALKRDLLEVISRYVDIDAGAADVTFEQRDHEVAMLASIPITGVRERQSDRVPTVAGPLADKLAAVTVADPSAGGEMLADPLCAVNAAAEPVRADAFAETPAATKPSSVANEPVVAEQPGAAQKQTETAVDVSPDRSASFGEHATSTGNDAQSMGEFATAPARSGNAARPRRRRRKKSAPAAPEIGNS